MGSEIAARNRKSLATFHHSLKSQCSTTSLLSQKSLRFLGSAMGLAIANRKNRCDFGALSFETILKRCKGHAHNGHREKVLKVMNFRVFPGVFRVFSPGVLRSKDFFDPIFVVFRDFCRSYFWHPYFYRAFRDFRRFR